jgi:hypothetical protein
MTTGLIVRFARQLITLIFAAVMLGCGIHPLLQYRDHDPPGVHSPVASSTVIDDRAGFRRILCAVTEARKGLYPDEMSCSEALHTMDDEGSAAGQPVALGPPKPVKVVIVTGIFGECIGDYLLPFSDGRYFDRYSPQKDGYTYLRALGYDDIDVIVTQGRSSTTANGKVVHDRLEKISRCTTKDIVIIAYSKGVTDTLHGLTLFSTVPSNIRALVSVAGVVAGTPIADGLAPVYGRLLKDIPYGPCPPGDGEGVRSLSREKQFTWLSRNKLPQSVRYYSIAAFVPLERVNVVLELGSSALSYIDPRNDGQVLIQDAIIPGSTILGYLNGDHWAVAIAFGRSDHPRWRRVINHNAFPREVLMESILRYLAGG